MRSPVLFVSVLAVAALMNAVFAQQGQPKNAPDTMAMDSGSSWKCMAMMGMMMPRAVAATSDGGFVLLTGTKLQKYDRNMTFVKEVDAKPDSAAMSRMMSEMGNCPMMRNRSRGGMGGMGGAAPDTAGRSKR